LQIFKGKQWHEYDELMGSLEETGYHIYDEGVLSVKTADIIGLSLWPPEDLFNDSKMKMLKHSVETNGWHDPLPYDLNLTLMPNGKYTVCEGGNHRALLSSVLGIESIKAYVSVAVPFHVMTDTAIKWVNHFENQIQVLRKEAKDKNAFLNSQGIRRIKFVKEESELDALGNRIRKLHGCIDQIVKSEATRLGYAPNGLKVSIRASKSL
jgi:hypothetical protein